MPGGLFAMIALSFLVYRCAAANHRRRLLWVLLLWLLVIGAGFLAGAIAMTAYYLRGEMFATEAEEISALMLPTGIGMLAGAILCVCLVARKPVQPS